METKNSSSYYLAEELVFKILLLLPVTSLLSLRFVCKLWFSIISSPKFVETHLINSKKKNSPILKVITCYEYNKHEYLGMEDVIYSCTRDDVYIDSHDDSVRIDLPRQFCGTNRYFGSCNGLVCLVSSDCLLDTLYIWNPFTKLFKSLPYPQKKLLTKAPLDHLGFGFDCISNDYKILRIVFDNFVIDLFGNSPVLVAQLYSANADSWKEIEVPKTIKASWIYFEGISQIISFNFHDEVFRVHPYPSLEQLNEKSNVLEFQGSAAMIFESYHDGSSVLSLWTLDNVCGNVSWTNKTNLEVDLKIDLVVLHLGSGQFIVAEDYDKFPNSFDKYSGYFLYDHKKREVKKFSLPVLDSIVTSLIEYTESLVSLKGFKQETESSGLYYYEET